MTYVLGAYALIPFIAYVIGRKRARTFGRGRIVPIMIGYTVLVVIALTGTFFVDLPQVRTRDDELLLSFIASTMFMVFIAAPCVGFFFLQEATDCRQAEQSHLRRCRACDYDLRGNASGRCPECGRPIDEYRLRSKTPNHTPQNPIPK